MFQSLIAQLCVQAEVLPFCLMQAFEIAQRYGRRHITAADSPATILRSMLATSGNTFLIIDGLDEIQDSSRVLGFLHECSTLSPGLHVIGLSRDVECLGLVLSSWPTITIDTSRIRTDIEKFVSDTASALPVDDPRLKSIAMRRVLDRSGGMFLWARLAMDALSHATSPAHLVSLAERVPQGISAIYLNQLTNLLEMDTYAQELATKVLNYVSCSKRPLHWTELQFALANSFAAFKKGTLANHKPFRRSLVALVYPLVVYDSERDEFNFPHLSVREFLLDPPESSIKPSCVRKFFVNENLAAVELALACLSCLKMKDDPKPHFASYATLFWSDHVLEAPWSNKI